MTTAVATTIVLFVVQVRSEVIRNGSGRAHIPRHQWLVIVLFLFGVSGPTLSIDSNVVLLAQTIIFAILIVTTGQCFLGASVVAQVTKTRSLKI